MKEKMYDKVEDIVAEVVTRIVVAKTGENLILERQLSLIDHYNIDSLEMINCLIEIETALNLSSVNYEKMPLSALDNIVSLSNFYKGFLAS